MFNWLVKLSLRSRGEGQAFLMKPTRGWVTWKPSSLWITWVFLGKGQVVVYLGYNTQRLAIMKHRRPTQLLDTAVLEERSTSLEPFKKSVCIVYISYLILGWSNSVNLFVLHIMHGLTNSPTQRFIENLLINHLLFC